nr:TlpA disulfide reductase family protein [uncultured Trichococcus sp.]
MQKKVIWFLLGAAFLWVLSDFGKSYFAGTETSEMVTVSQGVPASEAPEAQTGINIGQLAYDFELQDMDGNAVKLSDYRGKKVFLNFWASWCPPCKAEMPHLQAFSEEQEDTVVLGVNVTNSESHPDNAAVFLEENAISFLNLYGTDQVFAQYQVQSLPTSYLIGSDGKIYERIIGAVTKDILEAKFAMIK